MAKPKRPHFEALKPQHKKFLTAYMKCFNATEAMDQAGYKRDHANAKIILRNPKMVAAIQEELDAEGFIPGIIKQELMKILDADLADVSDIAKFGDLKKAKRAGLPTSIIKKIKSRTKLFSGEPYEIIEFELYDKLIALDKLMKIYSMATDKIEIKHDLKMYGQDAPVDEV